MCGIGGIHAYHYAAAPVDRAELLEIRDYMQARGPDGSGCWISEDYKVGLAHRRLSIIDLSERAAQPMTSADGRLVITFNGEIYNYRELRSELEKLGSRFSTDSDTEVILHMYATHGVKMLGMLSGMFALAIWDGNRRATLLARDPYGIKPLYIADDGWTCRFASQVKALLTSRHVSRIPEPAGIAGFFLLGSVPEPYTLYQEIRAVPAGSYQWVNSLGPELPMQYFDIAGIWAEAELNGQASTANPQHIVREAVLDSVRRHLVADVPVGAFLSAGIDSGALVGLMRDAGQQNLKTVTLGFSEYRGTPDDETPLAMETAHQYGTEHEIRTVDFAEFSSDLPAILRAMDQPSIDGINAWFVSKTASEAGLKVAISGVGGDELFGAYPSFRSLPRWVRMLWLPSRVPGLGYFSELMMNAFAPLVKGMNPKTKGMLRYGGTYEGAWLLRRGLFLPGELPSVMGLELAEAGLQRLAPIRHIASQFRVQRKIKSPHARVSTLESALYLRNQLLRDTDWASMAHSLEVRTPLVDAVLLKQLAPHLSGSNTSRKQWLASAPAVSLPSGVVSKSKTGFTTPVGKWQQQLEEGCIAASDSSSPWARNWSNVVMKSFRDTQ